MDKEQKEFELKKLEIEKAKVYEGILRTLVFSILTLGAGAGTLIFKILTSMNKMEVFIYKLLLSFVISLIFVLGIAIWKILILIRNKLEV